MNIVDRRHFHIGSLDSGIFLRNRRRLVTWGLIDAFACRGGSVLFGGYLGENDSALFWEREVDDELVVVDDKFPLKKVSWSGKFNAMKV